MRALLVFSSKAGRTKSVAEAIAAGLKEKAFEVDFAPLLPVQKGKPRGEKKKAGETELQQTVFDAAPYDFVVFGSPVFGLYPKRKISRLMEAYIRQCSGIEGKNAVVFLTCFGVPGTALKKISAMLQSRGAKVIDSMIVAYLLGVSQKQLEDAKEFGKRISLLV